MVLPLAAGAAVTAETAGGVGPFAAGAAVTAETAGGVGPFAGGGASPLHATANAIEVAVAARTTTECKALFMGECTHARAQTI